MEEEEKTYVTTYSDEYLKDIKKFSKGGNQQILTKIAAFLKELRVSPKKGTGKPEALKGYGEREVWSRRINEVLQLWVITMTNKKALQFLQGFFY